MKRILIYSLLFSILIGTFSCGKDSSCFKGTGKIIQEQRAIGADVMKISVEDNIDLVITYGLTPSFMIEAGENLMPYINSNITSDNVLEISSDNKCSMFRDYNIPITAYITLPTITNIYYTGQGNITSTNILLYDYFTLETEKGTGSVRLDLISQKISLVQHTGPADFTITGQTDKLYCYTGGNGWLHLEGLQANNVHANNAGSGDIIVYPIATFLVELTSLGNIDYYGNPIVTVSVHSGSGQLRKK